MDQELTQEELMTITAGMPSHSDFDLDVDSDEIGLEELDSINAGPNREAMDKMALEHPELYREKSIDALVEARIKEEERLAALDSQNHSRIL